MARCTSYLSGPAGVDVISLVIPAVVAVITATADGCKEAECTRAGCNGGARLTRYAPGVPDSDASKFRAHVPWKLRVKDYASARCRGNLEAAIETALAWSIYESPGAIASRCPPLNASVRRGAAFSRRHPR